MEKTVGASAKTLSKAEKFASAERKLTEITRLRLRIVPDDAIVTLLLRVAQFPGSLVSIFSPSLDSDFLRWRKRRKGADDLAIVVTCF